MWGRKPKGAAATDAQSPSQLKEAIHQARVEAAERTNVIVDLRDAELARLELLNEALNPLFVEVPPEVDLFDRGISRGETPRLWVDALAHVAMGRDKRLYRFLHDSRMGRRVLAESTKFRTSCRRLPLMWRAGWSSGNGRLRLIPIFWRAFQTRWRGITAGAGAGERWRSWRSDFSPVWRRCSCWQPCYRLAERSDSQ